MFCLLFNFRLESRKCMLLGALCPVYGLGGVAVAAFAEPFKTSKIATFFIGMIAASLIEYVFDMFYKELLGVTFWDYSGRPFNINGRVWLVYSVFWGVLSMLLVYKLHPIVKNFTENIPVSMTVAMISFFCIDTILSTALLYNFKTKNAVDILWLYRKITS